MKKLLFAITIALMATTASAQCFYIQSILADACNSNGCPPGATEGQNEMATFVIGNTALNSANLSVVWPTTTNAWLGVETNTTITTPLINALNSTIGACGYLKQPIGGVLPANSTVLIVTSTDMCTTGNSFATLTDTIYIIFQKAGNTNGHFANYSAGSGIRTLSMTFSSPASCTDAITYDKSLLINQTGGHTAQDGAGVDYTSTGVATYINRGCQAPYIPITVTASAPASACSNATPTLTGEVSGPATTYSWTTNGTGTVSVPTGTLSGAGTTTVSPTYAAGAGESGTITFTLTAHGKCSVAVVTTTVAITINAAPTPSIISSGGATICDGSSTLLTASSTGTLTTTYSWSPGGANTSTISVSPPTGTQIYTVTGTNSCGSKTASFTVTTNSLPTILVTKDSICANVASGTLTASGASTYTWSNGVQTASLTASAGTYSVTGTDANGCKDTASSKIVSINLPSITTNVSSICIGVTSTLTASGGATNSYTWSPGGPSGNNTYVVTPASTTPIVVTGAESHGCLNTHTVTINTPTTVTITSNYSTCSGQAIVLQANPTTLILYTWTGTGVSSSSYTASVAPSTTESYTVSGVDANGCVSNQAITTVNIAASTQITVNSSNGNNLPCVNSTYTLTANGATTYTWLPVGGYTALDVNQTQISVTQGTAAVTFTVSGVGACPATQTVVTVNPAPAITLTISPSNGTAICNGGTVAISASGANSYTWAPSATLNNANSGTPIATPTTSTVYSITASDVNGCTVDSSISITVNNFIPFTVPSTSICAGQTATLTASNTTYTYTWQGSSSTASTITVTPVSSLPQTYTVNAIDANGCTGNAVTATVNTFTLPIISITANPASSTICAGSPITLSGSGANSYTWTGGVTDGVSFTPPASPLTQTFSVIGSDGNGCISASPQTATVTIYPTTNLSVTSLPVCMGDSSKLVATGANTYTWSTSATTSSIAVLVSGNQTYTVTGTDIHNCLTALFVATAMVNALPNISITPSATSIDANSTVTLTANGAGTGGNYTWNDGSTNTTLTSNLDVQTSFTVVGVDANGCSNTDTITIKINPLPSVIVIPNIFSPNGDNINDVFSVTATGINNFDCKVYDRWGLLLHEWAGVDGGWDGKAKNGTNCTDGTYFYLITYMDNKNKSFIKNGFFQLIR